VRVTKQGARLAPRAIAIVEAVDARFFADVPTRETLRFLRRLAKPPEAGRPRRHLGHAVQAESLTTTPPIA
jgi:hypothetical protein